MKIQILVYDDNVEMCELAQHKWNAYNARLIRYERLEEAIDDLKKRDFSLIAIKEDFVGLLLYTTIDAFRKYTMAPIIVLTETPTPESKIKALKQGADDYILVPETLEEGVGSGWSLIRRYRGLLPNMNQEDGAFLPDDLYIDYKRRTVFIKGAEIALTYRDYELLVFLTEHPNQTLSYEQIFSAVWDEVFVLSSVNVVRCQVYRLKKKLREVNTSFDSICAVNGTGYKFVC